MENETWIAEYPFLKINESRNALMPSFDLPVLIEKIKHNQAWADGELNSMVLFNSPFTKILLTAMHGGTEIYSFQNDDSISFRIIEGKVLFQTRKKAVILTKGELLTLHDNIKYSISTEEDSVILLTIANGNLQITEN